ncbi:MAG: AAA family ATPase [Terracidiphilus sp.]|nr:AAA family ATPase [Terracidiphilus sp.]
MSDTLNQTSAANSVQDEERTKYLPFPPVVLAIAGCSGSGKTTLAAELARTLGGVHFHFDNYYRDLVHLPLATRAEQNFDDPALIESPLLIEHVAALSRGEAIERPLYDFSRYIRIPGRTETFRPGPCLLVEGLFALYFPELLPLYQLRVYIDTPDELCFERRLKRDMEERGRTAESVKRQYDLTVRPASLAYVRPSAVHADIHVDGSGALDWKVERVMAEMRTRGLLRGAS